MLNETIVIYQWADGPNVCSVRLYDDGACLVSGRMPPKSMATKEFVCSPDTVMVITTTDGVVSREAYPSRLERNVDGTGTLWKHGKNGLKAEQVSELDAVWLDDRFQKLAVSQRVLKAHELALRHRAAIAAGGAR